MCTGEKGDSLHFTNVPLHYKARSMTRRSAVRCGAAKRSSVQGCKFHRVVSNFIAQSGDFTLHNGKGGEYAPHMRECHAGMHARMLTRGTWAGRSMLTKQSRM